jgi:hypothetical protein
MSSSSGVLFTGLLFIAAVIVIAWLVYNRYVWWVHEQVEHDIGKHGDEARFRKKRR